jgi:hypothetical protein
MEVIRLHVARLRDRIAMQQSLCERLEAIAAHLEAAEEVSADHFIRTIQEMTMIESYYTPEQLDDLKKRGEQIGQERIQQSQQEWAELIAQVHAEMEKGTDPTSPEVQAMARRWMALIEEFTGGDPGIARSMGRLWQDQGDALVAQHNMPHDPRDVQEYIGRAMAAARGD